MSKQQGRTEDYTPITSEWLRENGYDGLVNPGECGSRIEELRACGFVPQDECEDCIPAHIEPCTRCGNGNCTPSDDDDTAWCMRAGLREEDL